MTGGKRQRLLDWIRNGDPSMVPVMLGPGPEIAASYLRKPALEVTPSEMVRVSDVTGTHNIACLYCLESSAVWPYIPGIEVIETRRATGDGELEVATEIHTPAGLLRSSEILSAKHGTHPHEHLVKDDSDLPALVCLMEKAREAAKTDPGIRRRIEEQFGAVIDSFGGAFPTLFGMTPSAMTLMIYPYMAKEQALFAVSDQRDLMEHLMDCEWEIRRMMLEAAAGKGVDIYRVAVNGFEWLSLDLYERYMIPQTRRIADFAASHGKLSWVHTCGKLKAIAHKAVYDRMGVSVVESLSAPPTGDVDNLAATRGDIGPNIVTRGGLNNELFYEADRQALVARTGHVLEATAGFRHIVGDTNPPAPPYPWASVEPVLATVRASGRLYE